MKPSIFGRLSIRDCVMAEVDKKITDAQRQYDAECSSIDKVEKREIWEAKQRALQGKSETAKRLVGEILGR